MEIACALVNSGSKVTVVDQADRILKTHFDEEISDVLQH
jgi:pyruvate/2-oxoglutarate dehydrogenase complex dihydrolipoamide dehydrogenase (E3) component